MTPLTCAEIEDSLLERASSAEPQLTPEGAQHVAACLRCSELVAGLKRVREALSPATVEPPASLGARLLAHVRGDGRFSDLAPEVSRLFDVDDAEARRLLSLLTDESAWMEGPFPGVRILPVQGGPRVASGLAAFVRLPAGVAYPAHVHHGVEENFVLQGGFREDSGEETWAGEWCHKTDGSRHGFVAVDGPDCITASVVSGEVEFLPEPGDA